MSTNARNKKARGWRRGPMPLDRWLGLRRWQRRLSGLLILTLAGLLLWRAGWTSWAAGGDAARIAGSVTAVPAPGRLTMRLENGAARTVRLAGLRHPSTWRADARQWLSEEALGRSVVCVRVGTRPSHRRPKPDEHFEAFVYLDSGRLLNERMVDAGYAEVDPSADHALAAWLAQVRDWASFEARGLWGTTVD